jgi:phytoene synthase
LDLVFADIVSTSSDRHLGAIRLAWWRERLEDLDQGHDVPAEPRLQALSAQLLERGIRGAQLSQLEDGWLPLLEPFPWGPGQAEALSFRGSMLFRIGARLLRSDESAAAAAGAVWSLVDGARHCSDRASRALLMEEARSALADVPARMPRRIRGLTVVGAIAATELFGDGDGARRLKAAIAHRLFGTFPRN